MERLFESVENDTGIDFGEEIEINPKQVLLPVIVDGEEISTDIINFIIEPHIICGDVFYQPHIKIAPSMRHKGLGYRIYKSFIYEFGNLYAHHWCRTNNEEIPKIYAKLAQEKDIEVKKTEKYYYAYLKNQEIS